MLVFQSSTRYRLPRWTISQASYRHNHPILGSEAYSRMDYGLKNKPKYLRMDLPGRSGIPNVSRYYPELHNLIFRRRGASPKVWLLVSSSL